MNTASVALPDERRPCLVIVDPVAHFFRYATAARAKGLRVLVLSSNAKVCRAEEAGYARMVDDYPKDAIDVFLTYEANNDASALDALAAHAGRIAGMVAGDEVTVASTARLGRALGFPYALPKDAKCQQIKSLMKERLAAHGVPTPCFVPVSSLEAAREQWTHFGRDSMVKMVDYAMSYGVFRARSLEELEHAWAAIQTHRRNLDHDFSTEDTVLIEEFIGGREFSVEGYEQNGRIEVLNFCEKLTHSNFMVVGHYIPARVDAHEDRLLRRIAQDCVMALGIRNSVFHAEVHIHEGRAYIIECAARPPGQYSVGVIKRVYDFDLVELSIDLACGRPVCVQGRPPNSWNAIMALYSDNTGIVKRIDALEELRARQECYFLKCGVEPGDAVHRLETFRDVLGLVLLEAPDPASIEKVYRWARGTVRFRV
jgi:biotin carboxylase